LGAEHASEKIKAVEQGMGGRKWEGKKNRLSLSSILKSWFKINVKIRNGQLPIFMDYPRNS
jgi:hypothetical protein